MPNLDDFHAFKSTSGKGNSSGGRAPTPKKSPQSDPTNGEMYFAGCGCVTALLFFLWVIDRLFS